MLSDWELEEEGELLPVEVVPVVELDVEDDVDPDDEVLEDEVLYVPDEPELLELLLPVDCPDDVDVELLLLLFPPVEVEGVVAGFVSTTGSGSGSGTGSGSIQGSDQSFGIVARYGSLLLVPLSCVYHVLNTNWTEPPVATTWKKNLSPPFPTNC